MLVRTSLSLGLNLGGKSGPGGEGPPPWTPESEAGLAFWVDAQNAASLTLDGTDILGMDDLVNSTDLGNASGEPPVLVTVNGHPMARLGPVGSGALLRGNVSPAEAMTVAGGFTFALVIRDLASGATHTGILQRLLGASSVQVNVPHDTGLVNVGFGNFNGDFPSIISTLPAHATNDGETWLIVVCRDGSTATLYIASGGVPLASSGSTALDGGSGLSSTEFGKSFVSNLEYDGYVGESIFWNSALDATARSNLEAYMQTKWSM